MAKMMGPRFKLCRSLGLNVLGHPKAMKRAKPGTSRADKKLSNYGMQLLEKQRLRAYYGVLEKQFATYVKRAKKSQQKTGEILIQSLETRLDNMVYRLGLAKSIRQARQMVVHGHIRVNGKKVDRPSYGLQIGDAVELGEKAKKIKVFTETFNENMNFNLPYIEKYPNEYAGKLIMLPNRKDIPVEINDHLVVEFYS